MQKTHHTKLPVDDQGVMSFERKVELESDKPPIAREKPIITKKMRKFSKDTREQVVETLSSDSRQGLSLNQVVSLRRAHGLNKLEEEAKVR